MTNLMKYNAADLDRLMEKITRNSIGMDEYFDRLFKDRKSTRLNSSHVSESRMPSSA